MKSKLMWLILLSASGFGADTHWYVDPSVGSDAYIGTTWENPWATLGHAIDSHTSSSGDTVTIYVKSWSTASDPLVQLTEARPESIMGSIL